MSFRILALVAAGFAIQSALRIHSEEAATHAEQILATPTSRERFAASHLVIAFGGTVVVLCSIGVAFGVSDAAVTGDFDAIPQSLVGMLAFVPAVWLLVGVTTAVIGLTPRAVVLPWVLLGVCFVIGMFGQLLDLPALIQDISPFQHVPPYPAADLRALPLTVLTASAVGLTAIGLAGFRRRDLG
jgi:ABC-2 type transport system permease protein